MTTLIATYPALTALADTWRGLPLHEVPAGTTLFREHEACAGFPLLLQGEVRVSRNTSQGRTLELYRVVPGELCLVSSSALFAQTALSAQGVTTRDTQVALLPPAAFRHALADTAFRDFVLGLFAWLLYAEFRERVDRDANLVKTVEKDGQQITVNRWNTTGFLISSASSNESGSLSVKIARGLGIVGLDTQARI